MVNEREMAGLRCGETMAELSEYLDWELDLQRRALIEAHLTGCDQCDRFGKEIASVEASLRGAL